MRVCYKWGNKMLDQLDKSLIREFDGNEVGCMGGYL